MSFISKNIFFPPNEIREDLDIEVKEKGNNAYLKNYTEIYDELVLENKMKEDMSLSKFISSFQRIFIGYVFQSLESSYYTLEEYDIEEVFDLYWDGIHSR